LNENSPSFEKIEEVFMSFIEAVILGIVQGLTEFLPISSTAHLRVVPALAGWKDPGAAFTAIVQLGTLIAVFFYFWSDVVRLAKAFWKDLSTFQFCSTPDAKLAWMIAVGTIPIVVLGLTLKKPIEGTFRNLYVVSCSLIGFSILLAISEFVSASRRKKGIPDHGEYQISWRDALLIGFFQALALVPGASRSGVTITAGLFVGLSRSTAARFSFLLSLPSILGAGLYELYSKRKELFATNEDIFNILVATVVSGVVGYASIAFLLSYLRRYNTYLFIVYRIVLGIVLLVLLQQGILQSQSEPAIETPPSNSLQ
jgi:undecaprenyl-diphosphatase